MAISASVIARDDTLLGVCFAIGQDFGFNPTWLRMLFAVPLLWSPPVAVGAYLGLGAVVALSRWLVPEPRPDEAAPAEAPECVGRRFEDLPLAA